MIILVPIRPFKLLTAFNVAFNFLLHVCLYVTFRPFFSIR